MRSGFKGHNWVGHILLGGRGRGMYCTRLALGFVPRGKAGNTSIYVHLFKIFVQHAIVRRLLGTSSVLGWGCKGRERET